MTGSSSVGISTPGSSASSINCKKKVEFNERDQPIGQHAAKFASKSGKLVRTHVPITYETWRKVPSTKKDEIWSLLMAEYEIPTTCKDQCLKSMSEQFRKYKAKLRKNHYDKHHNDVERVRDCPNNVRLKDWKEFVTQTSSPKMTESRKKNGNNRKKLKVYHTTGRTGHAGIEERMKQERKDGDPPVTRSGVWIVGHTSKDGSCSSSVAPLMEKIREIESSQCDSISHDIRYDPVSQVMGPDNRGRVRGHGTTVSRSKILSSASVVVKLAQKEKELKEHKSDMQNMNAKIEDLQESVKEIKESIKIALERPSNSLSTCSTDRQPGTRMSMGGPSSSTLPPREATCTLFNWKKRVVATGTTIYEPRPTVVHGRPLPDDCTMVVLLVIHDPKCELPGEDGIAETLEDVGVGGVTIWPTHNIQHT